jgi:transposase InsO family protein
MPWKSVSLVSLRKEFVSLCQKADISFSDLCRRYGISRKTGYKWLARFHEQGAYGLADRSRRPHRIVRQVAPATEQAIVALRRKHPTWGARKIRRLLQEQGMSVPACSTITAIFHRHNLINPEEPGGRRDWRRFEHPVPNALWQMDFKGHFPTLVGPCHPLTILDDCSRFNLCLSAMSNQRTGSVQRALTDTFGLYGMPDAILVDNGSPWGSDTLHPYTPLTLWLIRIGVRVSHSSPYHPQTLGKNERFHRTLKRDVIASSQWRDLSHVQRAFDRWRNVYNFERPHEALGLEVPVSRYKPSLRPFPEKLPDIAYPDEAHVRKVQQGGEVFFKGRTFRIPKCFCGYPVGVLPTLVDGVFNVLFCNHTVTKIDLRKNA